MSETLSNHDQAIRKIKGIYEVVRIGNVNGFEMCNMKATEQKLKEVLSLLKKES
ncbi:hypothetical protein [Schinkia azotoformans]|uniref:hypothetical protein n=1 Tax=Schinkia azotoformans TaxID=1454 RepID=UPI002DB71E69|nr:hypothetical protein [Schinkia azotoformans]MEC1714714.1 hypothetical protein [Schinkia azotoformans]MEC1757530.1 hypothetical protein [Schinkia azotoformans]